MHLTIIGKEIAVLNLPLEQSDRAVRQSIEKIEELGYDADECQLVVSFTTLEIVVSIWVTGG